MSLHMFYHRNNVFDQICFDYYTSYWVYSETCRICSYCFFKTKNILNSETHLPPKCFRYKGLIPGSWTEWKE